MTAITNLTMTRGDTFSRPLQILDEDGGAFALAGCSAWFTIKDFQDNAPNDDGALCKLYWTDGGAESGISANDPAPGWIRVTVPKSATALFQPGRRYKYDVQVLYAGGTKTDTPVKGEIVPTLDVTIRETIP